MRLICSLFTITILFLGGCNKNEIKDDDACQQQIMFSTQHVATRGIEQNDLTNYSAIRLWAYHNQAQWSNAQQDKSVVYINTSLQRDGLNVPYSWDYTGVRKYWPDAGHLSFFGYAVDNPSTENGITINESNLTGNVPVITYTAPDVIENQPDLLVLKQVDEQKTSPNVEGNKLTLNVKHALSSVDIQVKTDNTASDFKQRYDFVVRNITLQGVSSKGTLSLNDIISSNNMTWYLAFETKSFDTQSFKDTPLPHTLTNTATTILPQGQKLFMLPQTITTAHTLYIEYDIIVFDYADIEGEEKTVTLSYKTTLMLPATFNWLPGKRYIYLITIGMHINVKVLSANIEDWGTDANSGATIIF